MLQPGSFDFALQEKTKAALRCLWGAGVVQVVLLSWTLWTEEWMAPVGNLVLRLPELCAGGINQIFPNISQATMQ